MQFTLLDLLIIKVIFKKIFIIIFYDINNIKITIK